jgi:hypothetical protein
MLSKSISSARSTRRAGCPSRSRVGDERLKLGVHLLAVGGIADGDRVRCAGHGRGGSGSGSAPFPPAISHVALWHRMSTQNNNA